MKKHILMTILTLITGATVFAQQTPQQIADLQKQYQKNLENDDDGFVIVYKAVKQQIEKQQSNPANCAVWHNYLASLLESYWQGNRHKILDRTPIEGLVPEDPEVWDCQTLVAQIIFHYQKSLENAELLSSIPIKMYQPIFDKEVSTEFRPTLYDFLAFQALDYLSTRITSLPIPSVPFNPNNTKYWSSNEEFAQLSITSPDSLSFQYLSLRIMQSLTETHLHDQSAYALLDVTSRRFNYLKSNCNLDNAKDLHLEQLNRLEAQFRSKAGYELVTYALGEFYCQRGELYDKNAHPEYKDDFAEAIRWFKTTIQTAPNSLEAKNAKDFINHLTSSSISIQFEQPAATVGQNLVVFNTKNCTKLKFRIIPISQDELNTYNRLSSSKKFQFLLGQRHIFEQTFEIPNNMDGREKSSHYLSPDLKSGRYILFATDGDFSTNNKGVFTSKSIEISSMSSTYRESDGSYEFHLFDRITGHPISDATIELALYNNYRFENCISRRALSLSSDGTFEISCQSLPNDPIVKITATRGNETHIILAQRLFCNNYHLDSIHVQTDYLFTDRKIYRPGQTVYFKGISIASTSHNGEDLDKQVVVNQNINVNLMDANSQLVESFTCTTNEYGSFSGSFVLQKTGLTGNFHILTDHGFAYVSVEEYKRPTFEITMEKPKEDFKIGDTVRMKGSVRAYAGYAIDGATVKYSVQRKQRFPWLRSWWWRPQPGTQQIADGEVQSNSDGTFHIQFIAKPDVNNQRFNPLYTYEISIDVTDITGETHSTTTSVMVSNIALQIRSNIPDIINSDDPAKATVEVVNLSGEPQTASVHYTISLLNTPEHYLISCPDADCYLTDSSKLAKALPHLDFGKMSNPESWTIAKNIADGNLTTNGPTDIPLSHITNLKEGTYRITFTTQDRNGNEILEEGHFTIYHPNSKKCVVYKPLWIQTDHKDHVPGDTLHVTFGTYLKDAHVIYEIYSNDHLLASHTVRMNQEKINFDIPLTTEDLGFITIYAFTAQNNRTHVAYEKREVINPNKDIDFEFITFRDKTLPGSEEQYLIKLKNSRGNKVAAELLCSMYDASLDALAAPNQLKQTINQWDHLPFRNDFNFNNTLFSSSYSEFLGKLIFYPDDVFERSYPAWAYLPHFGIRSRITLNCVNDSKELSCVSFSSDVMEESVPLKAKSARGGEASNAFIGEEEAPISEGNTSSTPETSSSIRTNFAETAFFYPHLQTDADGNILISFKMPESLTRWKLQGFAHNPELMSGYFCKFVQTAKKIMVVPNAPRFLREGDTLLFSAKIVNTDSIAQCGNVRLSLRNALDDSPLNIIDGSHIQPFEVNANESQEVHFRIQIPFDVPAITYRIEATNIETPAFTDGEEATLPVLTNRILVTESMPLHISGIGQKSFTFNRLKKSFHNASSTLSTQSLTMEFTPNPIWYAIQAMPYLMEYPYECNEQIFSRYYANTLATNIVKRHPRIQEVFTQWQNETPDAFCSQLEKNEELKSALLEETPWVMDAQNEASRKQNISLLFDLQRMANEQDNAVGKLRERQNKDGGWSWFGNWESSTYITEHIIAGIGHLKELNVPTEFTTNTTMLYNALHFIDTKMNEYYQKHQKQHPKSSYGDIHYLYARSYFLNKSVPASCKTAYNFNYQNIKTNWKDESIYMQGMIALICYRNGDVTLAKQIIENIKSKAQYDEEMGMYWAQHGPTCYWQNAPIERQALLIEAFNTITHDSRSVELMQLWLLKQKQTQSWPTTKSTTEAIYALLLNNDQLDNCEGVQLSMGNWHYTEGDPTVEAEAGTGYIKKSWTGKQVTEEMSTININKQTNGPAWGGLYWQYLENVDKVEHSQDGKFGIQKQLYKVVVNDRGEVLTPITEQTPLQVGDRVRVRVEIRTDRDMEYVHLKDMRASCFEPTNVLSGYKHQDGLWYYESTRDAATNFFIDYLPKGTYVFEYTLIAIMAGSCSNGLTSIQCMYAPEFSSHSEGIRVIVK